MISTDAFKNVEAAKLKPPTKEELAKKDPSEYSEKEKMVSGRPYVAFGSELVSARKFAKVHMQRSIKYK